MSRDVNKLVGRIVRKVKVQHPSLCWVWQGKPDPTGYGRMALGGGQTARVHRVMAKAMGMELTGKVVMHICDNKLCVNPTHLKAVTHEENMRDMKDKGRARLLNPLQARVVRRLHGRMRQVDMAEMFGVTQATISNVQCRNFYP